jgi:hypothetical protein
MKELEDNPREEVLKPSPENMEHIAGNIDVKVSRSTGRPLDTEDMCFMFVYWGIGIHLSYLMFERAMNPSPGGIAIPQVDVDAMRQALPWPDKVFHTLELLPQYQAALNTWDDMPFLRHDEISSGMQYLVNKPSEISLWATFGITLFLDIQTTLGKKPSQPFHELQTHLVDWQQHVSLDRDNTTTHFKRDIEMTMKGALTSSTSTPPHKSTHSVCTASTTTRTRGKAAIISSVDSHLLLSSKAFIN